MEGLSEHVDNPAVEILLACYADRYSHWFRITWSATWGLSCSCKTAGRVCWHLMAAYNELRKLPAVPLEGYMLYPVEGTRLESLLIEASWRTDHDLWRSAVFQLTARLEKEPQ